MTLFPYFLRLNIVSYVGFLFSQKSYSCFNLNTICHYKVFTSCLIAQSSEVVSVPGAFFPSSLIYETAGPGWDNRGESGGNTDKHFIR